MTWHASYLYFNLMDSCYSRVTLMLRTLLTVQKRHIPARFNVFGNEQVCNTCQTFKFLWPLSPHVSTLDIGVLSYIGVLQHKEYCLEVWHIPPGTRCI
jgi:hypothetical protein